MLAPFAPYRKIVLCVILISRCSTAFEKYWLPDLEWRTASNWADGRVPEIDSRVIFPQQTRHAVGIAGADNLRLSEIDLPRQGLLVLPRNGQLQLSDSRTDAKVSRWSKEGNIFWADPANWNGSSIAAPHLERVPCRQDNVVLPSENHTFSILLPVREIEVKSIRLSNERQPFTEWEWQNFQDRREFSRGGFTVKYSDLYLTMHDCKKCFCQGDSQSDYLEEICAIQRPRCGFTGCEYPLTVEGHCCPYCGGRVSISEQISLATVQFLADEALEGYTEKVAWHTRRTWKGGVEILVKEKEDYSGNTIQEAVENLREMLRSKGIDVTNAETAGAAMKDSRLAVTLGPLLGTPLVVIALLLLAFLYYGYSLGHVLSGCMEAVSSVRDGIRKDKQKHGFARFENVPEGNVQIANVPGMSGREADDDVERIKQVASAGRFENPLYRSKRDKMEKRKIFDIDAPLSLTTLKSKIEDQLENEEMDTEE
ncbi:protein amnionless-like [Temnothorax curvispinosus]|uniref:Protein amnionless n=1 Tax=Temnothorax curvispinosus TaxID=300111 RepID=A0A6J1PPI6_9HYME|nr:protein amnionless-like [Temnothorax curvispinosus]XP_024871635.1 protein amnionless-like [Temnothorax curvispinosus]